uniref:RING finger protein 141 n=1 Tax=Percolomonas cosmopolitus TaxID=63605 RepID=A0A7S1KRS0_9EUKA|mmetsp:Transcript_6590/g.24679  ORF Transcript_6590/g.24679 Transcript_6590/m.24679 type:complete len:316 (+) Transcript_6590:152-1099(+)
MGNKQSSDDSDTFICSQQRNVNFPPREAQNIYQLIQYAQNVNYLLAERFNDGNRKILQFELHRMAHWIEEFKGKNGNFPSERRGAITALVEALAGRVKRMRAKNEEESKDICNQQEEDTARVPTIEMKINVYRDNKLYARIPLSMFYDIFRRVIFEASLHAAILHKESERNSRISQQNSDWLLVQRDLSCTDLPLHGQTEEGEESELLVEQSSEENSHTNAPRPEADPDDECFVCMERRVDITLPCTHRICAQCLELWKNSSHSCPLCRSRIESNQEWQMPPVPTRSDACDMIQEFILKLVNEFELHEEKAEEME